LVSTDSVATFGTYKLVLTFGIYALGSDIWYVTRFKTKPQIPINDHSMGGRLRDPSSILGHTNSVYLKVSRPTARPTQPRILSTWCQFRGVMSSKRKLVTHLNVEASLRMHGATPPLQNIFPT